ncbi:hypothetical protein QU481_12510 [Crenobacter sp. SG2303]|uniref:Molecular chaperone n=1 Tax=Crenobacter oryzisoli TaxID=3056844 RepID=A0ABT7XPQ3_9NEIS|nr:MULTISPECIES: hypothetical protein [unclassified Crenobacter]MDN0075710.1 hypothetical protein [Crenobacter sp. SG2303]MDN0083027.1 hypothetical protein [Crenobacter sp. SG2305]
MPSHLLTLPPLDQTPQKDVTRPERVEQWLGELPATPALTGALALLDAIAALNRSRLPAANRRALLGLFQGAVEARRPALLTATPSRQAITLQLALYEALFTGHRRILTQQLSAGHQQAALDAAGAGLLVAHRLFELAVRHHSAPPPGFWQRCHELFSLLRLQGWEFLPGQEPALGTLYRRLLLLGLLPAGRLTVAQFDWLVPQLLEHAVELELRDAGHGNSAYYLMLDADAPPQFHHGAPTGPWLRLGFGLLIARLRDRLQAHRTSQIDGLDTHELLRLVLTEWTVPAHHAPQRELQQQALLVHSGLASIWFVLAGQRWPSAPADPPSPQPAVVMIEQNHSQTGFTLHGEPHGLALREGELVLCRSLYEVATWQLGLVRWATVHQDGSVLNCGVERLSADASPVLLHCGPANAFMLALELPPLPLHNRQPQLLLPGRPFVRLLECRLHDRNGERRLKLSRLAQQTPLYQLVEFLSDNMR